jgi:hypothetical protein
MTVSLTISASLANGDYYGDIQLTGGTIPLNLPYWVNISQTSSHGSKLGGQPI